MLTPFNKDDCGRKRGDKAVMVDYRHCVAGGIGADRNWTRHRSGGVVLVASLRLAFGRWAVPLARLREDKRAQTLDW